jgi:hypothetical protein
LRACNADTLYSGGASSSCRLLSPFPRIPSAGAATDVDAARTGVCRAVCGFRIPCARGMSVRCVSCWLAACAAQRGENTRMRPLHGNSGPSQWYASRRLPCRAPPTSRLCCCVCPQGRNPLLSDVRRLTRSERATAATSLHTVILLIVVSGPSELTVLSNRFSIKNQSRLFSPTKY